MITELLNSYNTYLFHGGGNFFSHRILGVHFLQVDTQWGARFTLWAPKAREVRVVGDFNSWDGRNHPMERITAAGIWSVFIPGLNEGQLYKYEITTSKGEKILKSDPYGFYFEQPPNTASVAYELKEYPWNDEHWMKNRKQGNQKEKPMNIYEVHLGSWRRNKENKYLNYRQLADELGDYVLEMGYTHIELLPITEHPFDGSWGYQATGYFAATSRYGNPSDFKYFVDQLHQKGIGIILDWVPGHFCKDTHGLSQFDGGPLYEYDQANRAENIDWGTLNFNYGRPEVISFLVSNVMFWIEEYHIDGIRMDAVAYILYLDYGKKPGEWHPNKFGGRENLEAVAFIKRLNGVVKEYFPDVIMIAEESTQWPMVSRSTKEGGLGFDYKWNMGWMNDTLCYMETDPFDRKQKHNLLTFSFMYTFSEDFILPLSHDEVVHGKKSLLNKMPGDYWSKFANLRAYFGYMMAHPGKKLTFMGGEFGQFIEWQEQEQLDWLLLDYEMHGKLKLYVQQLNHYYLNSRALWLDHDNKGFQWIDPHDHDQSVVTFIRKGLRVNEELIIITNFTPVVRQNYRIGVPQSGWYQESFNSDLKQYGGSGVENVGKLKAEKIKWHNQPFSLQLTLPPLATIFLINGSRIDAV